MKCVIIGMGAAAISSAETILKESADSTVTIISSDKTPYSRCMLHYYLDGERTLDELNFVEDGFFTNNKRLTVMAGKKVVSVDNVAKMLTLDDNSKVSYDKLLIATGARPFIPPIENLDKAKNVYGFRDIDDVEKIISSAKPKTKAVIVGAGVAALDAAYGLLERGVEVSLIEMFPRISPIQLDEKAAKLYQKLFEEHGAKFYLSRRLISVDMDGENVKAVNFVLSSTTTFDKPEKVSCDFVIVIAGVRPNFALLENSTVKRDKAIIVDKTMKTSDDNIFAAGDCAGLSGIWPNAKNQGVVAARNMLGAKEEYTDVYSMKNSMNFYGLTTLTIGNVNVDGDDFKSIVYEDKNHYYRYVMKANRIVAALLQGNIARSGIWLYIIKNQIDISKLKKPIHKVSYSDFYKIKENGEFEYAV